MRKFDLNIERVLEDWDVYHGIREIIANAIDEQALTGTRDVEIMKRAEKRFAIRDYGRGLKYEHLTQNEDIEKTSRPENIIGKFGVGLKDALATFDRHKIGVTIKTKHGNITIGKSSKHEFEDVVTLHAIILPSTDPKMEGTEVILDGCTEAEIVKAKNLFLRFRDEKVLEKTQYGEILETKPAIHVNPMARLAAMSEEGSESTPRIYVNGVTVAEERNFLFSYNITSLTGSMRKALNRERTHVGRTAYTDRVKAILLASSNKEVARLLAEDLERYHRGTQHDETKYIEVATHASKILSASTNTLFVTPEDLQTGGDIIDDAISDGISVTVVPEIVSNKIRGAKDITGRPIRDLPQYTKEYNESFEFEFVDPDALNAAERKIYDKTECIFELIGGRPREIKVVKISETMRKSEFADTTGGVWEPREGRVVIKRTELANLESYAGTLLHEAAHALSGASDLSRRFELCLTYMIGKI